MVTNLYFSPKVKSEQNLYEDLVIESLKMYGQDVYYLPRSIVKEDTILGDDIPSKFSSSYKIEMYIDNIEGFSGEGNLFQKFGVEIRDQATLIVSRRRWKTLIGSTNNNISGVRPQEGDLIYLPLSKSLFQIMFVEHEQPFYQLSNVPTFSIECELFEYSDENMNTGIEVIDAIEQLGYEVKLTLAASGSNDFVIGETVTQTLGDGTIISAKITEWSLLTNVLSVAHVGADDGKFHLFIAGTLVSAESGITKTIVTVNEDLGDHGHQNLAFDSDVGFLSFDETNPFGDPS